MDYLMILSDIFKYRTATSIQHVINLVQESLPTEGDAIKLEVMINLLMESGDSTLLPDDIEELNEASGVSLDGLKPYYSDDLYEHLKDMLPNVDPDFLRAKADELSKKPVEYLDNFIERFLTEENYPTKQQYLKRQKILEVAKAYTVNFDIENFLKEIPNPFDHFYNGYKHSLSSNADDEEYAVKALLNLWVFLREHDIRRFFLRNGKNVIKTNEALSNLPNFFKTARKLVKLPPCQNIRLLQELAFVRHKKQLRHALKMKNETYQIFRADAERLNLLQTCQCCFDSDLLPEECYFCMKDCTFCKECIARGAEVIIGDGGLYFPCLANCNSTFSIQTLRMVLKPKVFEPLLTRIQMEEIKKANIPGLETCPSCGFNAVVSKQARVFSCENIECMVETCRECRRHAHVPLRCDEIEYDEDVKKRTYVENKMTEGLLRRCLECSKPFYKESGCNKMVCVCGAVMCYVCGQKVNSYDHFSRKGVQCPLFSTDQEVHHNRIVSFGNRAKQEINNNPGKLKFDPMEHLNI